jgi:HAD superfamily hydrolase (TIGR01484 family)
MTDQPLATALAQVRLIATDMDGTLTQGGHFTVALFEALEALAQANFPVLIVTGRSAGWVQGIVSYLPVVGAIAENGGVFFPKGEDDPIALVDLPDVVAHRQQLAHFFHCLQAHWPTLQESTDNRFRITDWTFDVAGLQTTDLDGIATLCKKNGWGFTYSTVQCHIRPVEQDKAPALQTVLRQFFPHIASHQVLTVGDSPNDVGLFDPMQFPQSVGVANVQHYRDRLRHWPQFITPGAEVVGFCQVVQQLLKAAPSRIE